MNGIMKLISGCPLFFGQIMRGQYHAPLLKLKYQERDWKWNGLKDLTM